MEGSLQLVTLLETLPHTLATLGLNLLAQEWPRVDKLETVPHLLQLHQFVAVSTHLYCSQLLSSTPTFSLILLCSFVLSALCSSPSSPGNGRVSSTGNSVGDTATSLATLGLNSLAID